MHREEALATLMEERAIIGLLSDYCHAYDGRKPDAYCDLFLDDATLVVSRAGSEDTYAGRAEIYENIAKGSLTGPACVHVTANTRIALDGERAKVTSSLVYMAEDSGQFRVKAAGLYIDDVVRTGAGWKFARRYIDLQYIESGAWQG